ncbi:alpha/beta fold hydrolase [Streptomyces sp. NPDC102405]|uniref:alpha/beta fold hydrolase n=1 Tax=Streptomyces sp. NPDC102405 TaxID=3366170 RepID=UPI00382EB187
MSSIGDRAVVFESTLGSRECVAGAHRWRYDAGGEGETVILLPGGIGLGIGWLDLALALAPSMRVISVDYPHTAASFDELADGVLAVLDAEGVGGAHVVGQSAGGMLAEVLSRRAPGRIRSMVLSGTGLYGPEDIPRLGQKLAALRAMPVRQLRKAVLASLRAAWEDAEEAEFWVGRVDAAFSDAQLRQSSVNSCRALLHLAQRAGELRQRPAWQGPMLMVRAKDDTLITALHTQRLLDLHPECDVRVFPTGGHSLLVTRPAEYTAAVGEFLARRRAPASGGSTGAAV